MPVCVVSEAVTVALPAVLSVTLNVLLPLVSAALGVGVALLSVVVIPTLLATLVTRFQLASTALTVTLKGVAAVCAVGVPVLPAVLPADAASPGTSNWSFAKRPGLTATAGLVLAVIPAW